MGKSLAAESPKAPERLRPSLSREADENQCISLSIDAAKKMLTEGTAPTSVILHFLKLATTREELERETMRLNQELMVAKKEVLESQARTEQLFAEAMKAMQKYSGNEPEEESYEQF